MKFSVEQLWIDEDVLDEPLTHEIVAKLPKAFIQVGRASTEAARLLDLEPDPLNRGKRILRLMKHKGAFIKPCPGTREYLCCGLKILHVGQGCPMDCRYCALQGYFNRPVMELFVNIDDLFKELDLYLNEDHLTFHRICTGEFTDSLALEPLTGMAKRLVTFFSGIKNASLEIKTKTDFVAPLLEVDPQGRVVLSFSVNSAKISRNDEKRSAPLEQRLAAAARAQDCGYTVGFHFDPIIPFLGWENEYFETIDKIFRHLRSASVAWISLGVLRFVPELKEVAEARFGTLPYFHDGFLRGLDSKMRLHVDRRIEIYHRIAERIRRHAPSARIYLCMESPHVWRESLDIDMETNEELAAYLDEAVK